MAIAQRLTRKLTEIPNLIESTDSNQLTQVIPVNIVPDFAITIQEAKQRVTLLQDFVKYMMISGQDYGLIPGCNKPSLLKPGAEKLCDIFGFAKHVEIVNRMEDWQKPFLHYEVKVTLVNKRTGLIEADGIGSCNSQEKKYASQNAFTIANTLIKMAKKRALVDAVLSATRSSSIFTQDMEDLRPVNHDTNPSPSSQPKQPNKPVLATPNQLKKIYELVKQLNMPTERVKSLLQDRYQAEHSQLLTKAQASEFIKYLLPMKVPVAK